MASISTSKFGGCCGIKIFHSACQGWDERRDGAALKALIERRIGRLGRKGLVLYTVTDSQREIIAVLEQLGFEVLTRFSNPNTGNWVTMYGLKINQAVENRTMPLWMQPAAAVHENAGHGTVVTLDVQSVTF